MNVIGKRITHDDSGFGLVEVLVSIGLLAILIGIGLTVLHKSNGHQKEATERTQITTGTDDAMGQVRRDVDDAVALRLAEAQKLTAVVIRDGKCTIRAYEADPTAGTFSVTTTFYEQRSCSGAAETSPTKVLIPRYTQTATFTYWGESETIPIPTPVQDLRNIKRVQWAFAAEPYVDRNAPDYTNGTSEVFDGVGEQSGSGTPQMQAKAPTLTLIQGTPGVDAPSLTWTDPTPGLTRSWVVTRAREWEGDEAGAFLAIGWTGKTETTFPADTSLEKGRRAAYIVYAILEDGSNGPSSNAQDVGLRPDVVTGVTAAGGNMATPPVAANAIKVTWNPVLGATSYDIYRDGKLIANDNAADTTYTDVAGYGHTHNYQVVAVNRWEQKLTTNDENDRVAINTDIATTYSGVVRLASPVTAASGAFTAPSTPSLTATPTTTWTTNVAISLAGWNGSGPATKNTKARDESWVTTTQHDSGAWSTLWASTPAATTTVTHGSRVPGSNDSYRAQACNAAGCSPVSATASALQRPPAPGSCTASNPTTRSMTVTVNPAAMVSPVTGYKVDVGDADSTGRGEQASNVFTIDLLSHSSGYTFAAQTKNASPANGGLSDVTTCSGTTAVLGVAITGVSSTTRTVNASMSTTNGSGSSLTLEGVRTDNNVGSASWDPLRDGTAFTVTARNTDGYNNVAAQQGISTKVLAAPGVPTCSVAVNDDKAPGSITVSGGDQVKLGSGSATGSPHTYGSLVAGTHTGYARNTNSDGFNVSYSGWDACGGVTITDPPPPMTQGCAMSSVTASPSPGVKWVFLNLCDSVRNAVLNYVYTTEFQSMSYDLIGNPSSWVDAKYNSTQGRSSVTVELVSKVSIRVRLTEAATGTVSSWFTITENMP